MIYSMKQWCDEYSSDQLCSVLKNFKPASTQMESSAVLIMEHSKYPPQYQRISFDLNNNGNKNMMLCHFTSLHLHYRNLEVLFWPMSHLLTWNRCMSSTAANLQGASWMFQLQFKLLLFNYSVNPDTGLLYSFVYFK